LIELINTWPNFITDTFNNTPNNLTTRVTKANGKLKSTHSLFFPIHEVVASHAHQRNLLHVEGVAKDDQTDQIPQEVEACP